MEISEELHKYEYNSIENLDAGSEELYLVKRDKKDFILKIRDFKHLEASWFKKEPLMIEKLREETDLPVPRVIEHNLRHSPPYFLMEKLEGEPFSDKKQDYDPETLETLVYEAGRALAKIHSSMNYENYGFIMENSVELEKTNQDWNETFKAIVEDKLDGFEDTEFGNYKQDAENFIDRELDIMGKPAAPVLGHNDFRPGNLLVKGEDIVGIVDWARAFSTDPLYELVTAELNFMNELENIIPEEGISIEFRNGYSSIREIEDSRREEVYALTSLLGLMKGFSIHWGDLLTEDERKEKANYLSNRLERILY